MGQRPTGFLPVSYADVEKVLVMGDTEVFNAPPMMPCWSEPYANMAAANGSEPALNRLDSPVVLLARLLLALDTGLADE